MKALDPHSTLQHDVDVDVDVSRDAASKLKSAYLCERTKLEILEVELNRDKVVMIDEQGKMRKIAFVSEH